MVNQRQKHKIYVKNLQQDECYTGILIIDNKELEFFVDCFNKSIGYTATIHNPDFVQSDYKDTKKEAIKDLIFKIKELPEPLKWKFFNFNQ